ncbi:hypothetical protein BGZ58_005400, partial [Dissophora ornata]
SHLEKRERKVTRTKERHVAVSEKPRMEEGVVWSSDATLSVPVKKFQNNVTLIPSRKRTWTGAKIQIPSDLDNRVRSPPSSPSEGLWD